MTESRIKHLEFIQSVVSRLNSNSFMLKGWAMTLISALFALAAKDANVRYVLISYVVIPTFWYLDAFYLATERRYRDLYDQIRTLASDDTDFSMDASTFRGPGRSTLEAMVSATLWPFYGIAVLATLGVMFLF